jgi:hypothetical protein
MPRYIIKIDGLYAEWSTIVDDKLDVVESAPITNFKPLDLFKEDYERKYGIEGMKNLPDRLNRVEEFGASFSTLREIIAHNRAGENKKHLTKKKLLETYKL